MEEVYFEWMTSLVFPETWQRHEYDYLLRALDDSIFHFSASVPTDENRMIDGIDLRYRFSCHGGYDHETVSNILKRNNSCSTLEMMVALSLKGDDQVLYDYETGSNADFIFWSMLKSLDLTQMTNSRFDMDHVIQRVSRFLNRDFDYDGSGGLFTVDRPRRDMRDVDIWSQMNWYFHMLYEKKRR